MVSFIIPVYNGEKYIERSLRSIINNTNGDYEIIVINDGSTDRTLEIIEKIKKEYCFIQVFSQNNSGVSSAREFGIKKVSGEWIVFVDADDYITSDVVKHIKLIQNSRCDWIIFSGQFQESCFLNINRPDNKKNMITAILNQNQDNKMINAKLNTVWSKAYKKTIIDRYGVRFEKGLSHGEDMIFNLDYAENCSQVYCCSESIYMLCANEKSATKRYQENCVKNEKEFFYLLNKRKIFSKDGSLRVCYYRIVLNGIWICLGQYFSNYENPKNFKERRKELAEFLYQEPYKTALMNYSVEKSKRKRCVFALLNFHYYRLVLKTVEILRKLSRKSVMGTSEI